MADDDADAGSYADHNADAGSYADNVAGTDTDDDADHVPVGDEQNDAHCSSPSATENVIDLSWGSALSAPPSLYRFVAVGDKNIWSIVPDSRPASSASKAEVVGRLEERLLIDAI